MTEREKQLLRREGYVVSRVENVPHTCGPTVASACGRCSALAAKAFPLPPVRRPLRGEFSDGTVAWWDGSRIVLTPRGHTSEITEHRAEFTLRSVREAADYALMARMLSGETEVSA